MIQTVKKTIAQWQMVAPGDKVLCAFSGGADSTCLCHVLWCLRSQLQISLCAVHINHCLRGEEADRDEAFARAFCADLEIPFAAYRADIAALAARQKKSIELCAREQRYRLFEKAAEKFGANVIATAHTANDNAETLLWNVIRGTGVHGLCGILPKRDKIIRPLLDVTREEVERYLARREIPFMTDSTNQSLDYTRNKLRNLVIPLIQRECNPNFVKNAGVLAGHMLHFNRYNDALWDLMLEDAKDGTGLATDFFEDLSQFELTEMLKKYLRDKTGISMESCHIIKVAELARSEKNGQISLPGGYIARRSYHKLYVEKEKKEPPLFEQKLVLGENYIAEAGLEIILALGNAPNVYSLFNTAVFDYDKIPSGLVARSRKTGDVYLLENGRRRTVKRLLIDRRIDVLQRNKIPIFEAGGIILWIAGFAPRKDYLPDEETVRFLSIQVTQLLQLEQ